MVGGSDDIFHGHNFVRIMLMLVRDAAAQQGESNGMKRMDKEFPLNCVSVALRTKFYFEHHSSLLLLCSIWCMCLFDCHRKHSFSLFACSVLNAVIVIFKVHNGAICHDNAITEALFICIYLNFRCSLYSLTFNIQWWSIFYL